MPLPLLAAALPFAMSAIGSGVSAFTQSRAAKNNLRAQQQRQNQIDAGAAQNAQQMNGMGDIASLLASMSGADFNSKQAAPTGFSFDPMTGQQISAPQFNATTAGFSGTSGVNANTAGPVGADMVDLDGLFSGAGSQAYNTGQDSLMQFLRADPASKMAGSNNVLQEIAATGLPSNMTDMFSAAANVNRDNNAELLASITGQSRSVGERFGSATRRLEGDTVRRLANEQSLQNSQFAMQAGESAANRRLGAATQLGQFQLQGAGQQLGASQSLMGAGQAERQLTLQALLANQSAGLQAGQFNAAQSNQMGQFNAGQTNQISQFNAGQFNQNSQFNAAAQNQAGSQNAANLLQSLMANQQSGNRANEFNANLGLQANQINNSQAMQAIFGNNQQAMSERGMRQTGMAQAGGLMGQQSGLLNQLLGIRAGVQTPQMSPQGAGAMGGGFQDFASLLAAYQRMQSGSVPSVPNVYIPPINIGSVPGANLGFTR